MKKKLLAGLMAASLSIGSLMWSPTVEAKVEMYVGTDEYEMSTYETEDIAQQRAKARALRNAQEQAAVFVRSYSKVENFKLKEDVIETISSTVLDIVDVKYERMLSDGRFAIRAVVQVKIDSDEINNWLADSQQKQSILIAQIKDLERSNAEKDREIEELKRQIAGVKTKADQERLTAQFAAADRAFLSNQSLREAIQAYRQNDYTRAVKHCNDALELNSDSALALFVRGVAYIDLKQYQFAISDYDKLLALDPKDQLVYFLRGFSYVHLKNYELAVNDFTKAIELNPKDSSSYFYRGVVYTALKFLDRAINDFNVAIELKPDYADVYYARGITYRLLENYDRAIEDFTKAIELYPENEPKLEKAYSHRSYCYYAIGDNLLSKADIKKAQSLSSAK